MAYDELSSLVKLSAPECTSRAGENSHEHDSFERHVGELARSEGKGVDDAADDEVELHLRVEQLSCKAKSGVHLLAMSRTAASSASPDLDALFSRPNSVLGQYQGENAGLLANAVHRGYLYDGSSDRVKLRDDEERRGALASM
jgi:hypothetical protein